MLVLLLLFLAIPAAAQDWPQWRGPQRDGSATVTLPKSWPEKLELEWKVQVGTGHSSPLIVGDRIYVHTRREDQEVAACLSLATGDTLWTQNNTAPYTMNPAAYGHGKGPKSTPLVHGNRLYTLGISGMLSCYDRHSGKLQWRHDFAAEFPQTSPLYGTSMSPLVADGLLVVHVGGHDRGALRAFDAATGERRWSWEADGPGYTSPIAVELDGVKQIVTQTQNFCVGVELATGALLWRLPYSTAYDQNIVTPVFFEQTIVFSGLDKGTFAVHPRKNGDTWTTKEIWSNPEISMYMSSPVLDGHRLFGLSHKRRGQFFCLDARSGKTLWTGPGRQGENASLTRAGDHLFLLTTNADLIIAPTSSKEFAPLAHYSVATTSTWAHPALLDTHILIKDLETLALWSLK